MKLIVAAFFLLFSGMVFSQTAEEARLNNQAVELMDKDRYQEALPVLDELTGMYPQNTIFRYNRAVTFFNLKKYNEALEDYKILADTLPDESEYVFQIGNAYEQLDSTTQAILYYTKAIEIENDKFMYFFKRGTIHLKQNNFTVAEADFNSSLLLNPDHDNSLHNRGIALFKLGETNKACLDWCRAHELGNEYSLSHLQKNCGLLKPCLSSK
jgi:tetratricopeptide (TPR) repeat protein